VNLEFKKINAQYANLQRGQLQQLLSTPSQVKVPDNKGNMVSLPMALARDAQMIEESMERIRSSKMDVKNVDAMVTLMKSTQLSVQDRGVILQTLAQQLGFKSREDPGFINWLKDYNQWRVLPPAPGEPVGVPPAGVPPAGLPRQR
jgi:Lhr-like helicase